MEKIDKLHQIELGNDPKDDGTSALGILRNPPPPPHLKPLPQWSKDDAQTQRKDRYKVLSAVRQMLLLEGRKHYPELPTKYHRSTMCKHSLTGSEVAVLLSQEHGKAFFDGLQTCGNVWTCPVCAAKVQERRRLEISEAMEHFYQTGNRQAVMVTFTFPHKKLMKLKDLLTKQAEGFTILRKGKQWDKFKAKNCFEGLIRSLEVTHGKNGWHPHTHELWFINREIDELAFTKFVQEKWKRACVKSGLLDENDAKQLKAFEQYAVDIKFNCKASDYLAKVDHKDNLKSYWGADREVAKASSKNKEGKGMHPFQLAIDNKQALFIEYVNAIKGKAQLFWSRGLKSKVGIDEKTDEELAEEKSDDADIIQMISKPQWFVIRRKEKRAQVLNCAENEPEKIRSFILQIIGDDLQNE